MESGFCLFHIYYLLPINRVGWQLGVILALAKVTLSLFSLTVFYIIILSGASSVYLCFTILGSYISILVAFKISPYLAGAVKSFSSLIGAILAEDLCVNYAVRA